VIYLVNLSAADFQRKKNKWLPKIHQWVQVRQTTLQHVLLGSAT
jgi:hypothetical protein